MKIPTRCNRRNCQARRTLSKRPELYRKWPECPLKCGGVVYVDEYRLRRGAHDNAPKCTDPDCLYRLAQVARGINPNMPHRVSVKGCDHNEAYKIERALSASKHCPHKPEVAEDAPF